jgi:hypothetical protein
VPAFLVAAALAVGWFLPPTHVAANRVTYRSDPERIWSVISDFEAYPEWREDVNAVERLPDREGKPVWVERSSTGDLTYEVAAWDPPRGLVTRIADPRLPFGGTWTYRIEPDTNGTVLTLTERGEIRNPLFRFMTRYVFGYYGGIDAYQRSLALELQETTLLEHVDTEGEEAASQNSR